MAGQVARLSMTRFLTVPGASTIIGSPRGGLLVGSGRERGIAAELVRDFERRVNQNHANRLGKRPLTGYILVARRDKLAADLDDGLAHIGDGCRSNDSKDADWYRSGQGTER
jgi:hypothetical protein